MLHPNADVDIIEVTVEESYRRFTSLIGEDTDLIVVLLYFAKAGCKDLYVRSHKTNARKKFILLTVLGRCLEKSYAFSYFSFTPFLDAIVHLLSSVL